MLAASEQGPAERLWAGTLIRRGLEREVWRCREPPQGLGVQVRELDGAGLLSTAGGGAQRGPAGLPWR